MLRFFTKRLERDEEGFTLIELMVVVLIIAILIAIAIPTFLGARRRAQDRAAQSSLRNALTSAKTIFTDAETYADASVVAMASAEPSLTFQTAASTGPKIVSIANAGATDWGAAALSNSGTCFHIRDRTTGPGTTFGTGTPCTGATALTVTVAQW